MSTQHVPRGVRQCRPTGGIAACTAGPTRGGPEVGRKAGYFLGGLGVERVRADQALMRAFY